MSALAFDLVAALCYLSFNDVSCDIKLSALVIESCISSTDPTVSAIAKGLFADKYVARDLREIISSDPGANDGFGFCW
jgi:hypothetical protein